MKWILLHRSYDVCEDAGPHEVDHLGHLVDVHSTLALQLLGQGAEGTHHARGHSAPPGQAQTHTGLRLEATSWQRL